MDNWEERCKAAEAELAQLQPLWGMLQREQVAFSQAEAERDAAQAEAERLRLERDGWMKASDELSAEIERLRSQVVTLEAQLQEARKKGTAKNRRQFAYSVLSIIERWENDEADQDAA